MKFLSPSKIGRLIVGIGEILLDEFKKWFRSLASEDRAGLFFTLIIHLVVIIGLLVWQIGAAVKAETSFVLDFSKQEAKEKKAQEVKFKEDISKRLDDMIKAAPTPTNVKNIAVDASTLKDDRGTDAKKLYEDAQKLQNELKSGSKAALHEDARNETVELKPEKERGNEKEYKGPSVVSYNLDGRKASTLKIPAYKCYGGGDVTVIIVVDAQGNVVGAKVFDAVSSPDQCLRDFAVRAARLSKFNKVSPADLKKNTGLTQQTGEIVYRFIAQ